jgi:hypothetical protein
LGSKCLNINQNSKIITKLLKFIDGYELSLVIIGRTTKNLTRTIPKIPKMLKEISDNYSDDYLFNLNQKLQSLKSNAFEFLTVLNMVFCRKNPE